MVDKSTLGQVRVIKSVAKKSHEFYFMCAIFSWISRPRRLSKQRKFSSGHRFNKNSRSSEHDNTKRTISNISMCKQ